MPTGSFSDIKALHVRGRICIARDKSQKRKEFLTCGADGTVYLWSEKCFLDNTAPEVVNIGEATSSCVVWKDEYVYVGCTTLNLLLGTEKKIIGRTKIDELGTNLSPSLIFGLDPVAVDVGDKFLAAAGGDFSVKILTLGAESTIYKRFEMSADVLSVAISPNENFCAVSTSDGKVSIYDIMEEEPKRIFSEKVFGDTMPTELESPRVKLAWSRTSEELYVPSLGAVKIIDASTWTVSSRMFRGKDAEYEDFSTLAVSPCGNYLAASTIGNKLFIWRTSNCEIISQNEYKRICNLKYMITDIEFSPYNGRTILLVDVNEGLCLWKNALPAGLGDIPTTSGLVTEANQSNIYNDDEDDDDDNELVMRKRPKFISDEADDANDGSHPEVVDIDEDSRMSADISAIKKSFGYANTGRLEDFGFGVTEPEDPESNYIEKPKEYAPTTVTKVVEYDPPTIPSHFVSGATPSHNTQRYLKWNRYGVVRSYTEVDNNSIEVEFHDASIHPEIILDNSTTNYRLADLSDHAVVLASSPEEKSAQSELLVIHIKSWDTESRRWSVPLPAKDVAIDVLVSNDVVCVLTWQRNIRVFTITGSQRHIISHPGPILTSALYGDKLSVLSVKGAEFFEEYQKSKRSKATYQYSVTTYDVGIRGWMGLENSVTSCDLAVTPGKCPLWLSYSNTGQLVTMDNGYNVRIKSPAGFWMPIFSPSELHDKSDGIWPISVVMQGTSRQFRYLYCKGSRHPSLTTKQVPIIADWRLPYCQADSDKSQLEESLYLNELQQNIANEIGSSTSEFNSIRSNTILKLFALACKSERETRASEFASFMSSSKGIQALCNYASGFKKHVLAEKVAQIGRENMKDSSIPLERKNNASAIAPRRVSMKRRTIEVQPPRTSEMSQAESVDVFEEREEPAHTEEYSQVSATNDLALVTGTPFNRNPFKRAADVNLDSSSMSVFDQLESSFDNPKKRAREDESSQTPVPSAKRQMKLGFSATSAGKENKK
ncbi:unnamed protein product [Auanema sp. JU1783]|nr:unnamed protein product [Auanema sp. JU1783]